MIPGRQEYGKSIIENLRGVETVRSKRFEYLDQRPVNQDGYALDWPEVGFIAMNSPFDPTPSIKIENGVVVEMDGKTADAVADEILTYMRQS